MKLICAVVGFSHDPVGQSWELFVAPFGRTGAVWGLPHLGAQGDTWTFSSGYHGNAAGLNQYTCRAEASVETAKTFCINEPTCIGFDWRDYNAGQAHAVCWYYGGDNQLGGGGSWEGGGPSGHYALSRAQAPIQALMAPRRF